MPITQRSYFDAISRGEDQRNALRQADMQNALAQQQLQTGQQRNDLMQQGAQEDQQKQAATRMVQTIQYALQSTSPKEFIRQNAPEFAAQNPNFDTETDDQIKQDLQAGLGHFGPLAGIGPSVPKGANGALYKYKDPVTGDILFGDASVAGGKQPYLYQPPQKTPAPVRAPANYRFKPDGSVEPIPGSKADPNAPQRPAAGKPPTEGDKRARVMYSSMKNSEKQLEAITTSDTSDLSQAILGKIGGGKIAQSDDFKRYEAAGLRWAANLLYLKSGATATPDEIHSTWMQFFPQIGDGPSVKAQKEEARAQELASINEAYAFDILKNDAIPQKQPAKETAAQRAKRLGL